MKKNLKMKKRLKSFVYAGSGIAYTLKTQPNFLIHIAILCFVILFGIIFKLSTNEWIWITLIAAIVLSLEIINTAIELLTDLISPEFNEKAGKIKDLSAGAVLLSAIASIVVGLIIFAPKLLLWLQN